MCKLKSGIILKDQVFVSDYDSHTYMLKELGIEDNEINAKTLFVRAELLPIDGNIFSDISTWKFNIDQDILPEWFVYDYDEQRMIEAIKEWKNGHIFENVDNLELKGNDAYQLKNCKNVKVYDNCKVIVHDNCTVYAYNNCTVNAYDNCTVYVSNDCVVTAHGNCRAYAYDDCTVNAHNDCTTYAFSESTVYAQDTSRIVAHGDCTVNAYDESMITAYDNSTIKAFNNSTVYAFDNSTVYAQNKSMITIYDDCRVYAYHNSIIKYIGCKLYDKNGCKLYDKNLKLFNNAIFINKATKTIFYQNEDYKFVKIGESGERV